MPNILKGMEGSCEKFFKKQDSRTISTGQLHASLHFHLRPINGVVFPGPSAPYGEGELILRQASRLDAFSGYPFRT